MWPAALLASIPDEEVERLCELADAAIIDYNTSEPATRGDEIAIRGSEALIDLGRTEEAVRVLTNAIVRVSTQVRIWRAPRGGTGSSE